ncbi:MAG TPA: GTP cyclohydrolase I FolE [Amnibacterium sp.]|nr:GTP cyclohydrolase I FolE [Amnibacterium sp.]
MTVDRARAAAAVAEFLAAMGEDPGRPALADTAARVAELGAERFAGVGVDPVPALAAAAVADVAVAGPVAFRAVPFVATCEHHLLPFAGTATIVYRPSGSVAGFGALARVVETLAARPQVQERLTDEIADAVARGLGAAGVLVVLAAEHDCVALRGRRLTGTSVVTLAARGDYVHGPERAEALALAGEPPAAPGSRPAQH